MNTAHPSGAGHGRRAGRRRRRRRGDRRHGGGPGGDRGDRPSDRRASQRPHQLARARGAAPPSAPPRMPVWAALPSMLLGVSLLTAVLGMYWDISLHIDNGRDAGPLANPAHYLILVGLYGALLAGVMTMALAKDAPGQHRRAPGQRPLAARRRAADHRLRRLRAHRLPARRPLAPPLRPGRDALGPDPPDADRRRLAGHARRHGADRRGRVLAGPRPRARGPQAALRPAPGAARGRLPRRALHLPGRVRLRRAAVPPGPAPDADHARRQHRPGRPRASTSAAAARCRPCWASWSSAASWP